MKILAIVVTYKPDRDLLQHNVIAFINDVDKVLIWENTPEGEKLDYRFIDDPKVEYCGDGVNSISHALNFAWRYAKSNGYDYLLTMDQDSVWVNFSFFIHETILNQDCPRGIWGPAIVTDRQKIEFVNETVKTEVTITSGMILNIDMIHQLGGWNERFRIDCVDNEFCLKAKYFKVPIYQVRFTNAYLLQRYGIPRTVQFGKSTIVLRGDSPERLYEIYKSHIMLFRLFPFYRTPRYDFKVYWISKIKWSLLFEGQRVQRITAIVRGFIEGLGCKLDEYGMYNPQTERVGNKLLLCYDLLFGK